MRYQIYEAKSVKYDAQQRVGIKQETAQTRINTGFLLITVPLDTESILFMFV